MAYKSVILSDNLSCKVRQLGLFELDNKGREVIGPYCYTILTARGVFEEDVYVFPEIPPLKPDKPENEITPESQEWFDLREWETYRAAVAHQKKMYESYEGYVSDIATYILDNCVSPEDRNRIIEPGDWDTIYTAVIVPQLTIQGVADTLKSTFPGFIWEYGDTRRADAVSEREGQIVGDSAVGA